eukprot:6208359-Pleurochrysis_carterae.AAC.3
MRTVIPMRSICNSDTYGQSHQLRGAVEGRLPPSADAAVSSAPPVHGACAQEQVWRFMSRKCVSGVRWRESAEGDVAGKCRASA